MTYYQEENEENKSDNLFGSPISKKNENEKTETDFVKDTFAKFGLNMNLYSNTI